MAAFFKSALWLDIEAGLPPQPETNTPRVDKAKTDNYFDVLTTTTTTSFICMTITKYYMQYCKSNLNLIINHLIN